MKFNVAFLALAITLAATAEAAPAPKGFGFFGGGKTTPSTTTGTTAGAGSSSVLGSLGGKYNQEGGASALNAGLGTGAGALALGAGAITAETNNEKDDQSQQQPQRRSPSPLGRVNSAPARINGGSTNTRPTASGGTQTDSPGVTSQGTQTGAEAAKGASWGDRIGTGNQALGLAAGGLAIWNADQGLQQQQDAQNQRRASPLDRRLNPAVAAEGAMMVAPMMMGGGGSIGPSFGNSHTDASGQKSGNSNVRVGASSGNAKRDVEASPLNRRLGWSFTNTHEDGSLQEGGNSNVRVGASSGGADPGRTAVLQSLAQGGGAATSSGGQSQQKQQKRLASSSGHSEPSVTPPSTAASRAALMKAMNQGHWKRLFSVSNQKTDESAQVSGNHNVRIGATSGNISPQVYAALNPGTTI